jgi:hypothetical protein
MIAFFGGWLTLDLQRFSIAGFGDHNPPPEGFEVPTQTVTKRSLFVALGFCRPLGRSHRAHLLLPLLLVFAGALIHIILPQRRENVKVTPTNFLRPVS